jgi:ABC-type multidrug transport system ATPase subunit
MTAAPSALLEVDRLHKAYREHVVLDDVSFALPRGCIAALSGSNGSGKSTLLRCLAGLATYAGTARLDGAVLDGSTQARRLVSYVPQTVVLRESASVAETVRLFATIRGVALADVDLPDGFLPPPDRLIGVLSGGQRQRVVLAAALLGSPRLLLLDEPAANLDDEGREALWSVLVARAAEGTAALIATPYPADLDGIADRQVGLMGGRVRPPVGGVVRRLPRRTMTEELGA